MFIDYSLIPGRTWESREYVKRSHPIVSIITPFWNDGKYLEQTAISILNQTFPYFEWIIVDDGSTDKKGLQELKRISQMDERIHVFHKENEGPGKARDFGVSKSDDSSLYILFIDSDDMMDKTFIETAYFSMKTYPDASWCYGDTVNFGDQEFLWQKQFDSGRMKHENLLTMHSLIKKEDFLLVDGFAVEGKSLYEDWNLWLKMLALGKYPIHMSYFAFWYRKIHNHGELSRAQKNDKEASVMIKESASKIKKFVTPIEFPREKYQYDQIKDLDTSIVIPRYKKNKKTKILVMVPWMTLGGADQFNLDLFRLIDRNQYFITLVSTQPTTYKWRQKFESVCDEVFDVSTFIDREYWPSFVDYLIKSRGVDILLNTNSTAGYMMLPYLRSKYPSLPIMDYIHMEEWYNRNGGYSRDSSAVTSVINKTLFCNQNSERIMHEHFGVSKEKLDTVYIGVDTKKFDPSKYDRKALSAKYHIPEGKKVISFTARIDYQKRPFLLIEIIRKFVAVNQDFVFVVAGDGKLLDPIIAKSREYGIDRYILYLGKTDCPDEIYAISDITLNCSIKEGLALTAYESLAMGVPVVSSDVGGQRELINSDVGVIVPCLQEEADVYTTVYCEEEIDSYVEALQKVAEDLDQYKSQCRKRILDGFSLENMASRMEQEFADILKMKIFDDSLSSHTNFTKELITEYFMQEKEVYDWYCKMYRLEVYGTEVIPSANREKIAYRKWQVEQFLWKIHFLEEARILGHSIIEFLRQCKRFVVALIKIPILTIYIMIKFISLLISKFIRTVKRKVGE